MINSTPTISFLSLYFFKRTVCILQGQWKLLKCGCAVYHIISKSSRQSKEPKRTWRDINLKPGAPRTKCKLQSNFFLYIIKYYCPPQKSPQILSSEISSDIIILRNPLRYYHYEPPQISSSEILNIVIHYQIVIRKSILFFSPKNIDYTFLPKKQKILFICLWDHP